jgi:hypothetical protein
MCKKIAHLLLLCLCVNVLQNSAKGVIEGFMHCSVCSNWTKFVVQLRPRAAQGISPPLLVNYEGIRFPAFCDSWKFVLSNVILVFGNKSKSIGACSCLTGYKAFSLPSSISSHAIVSYLLKCAYVVNHQIPHITAHTTSVQQICIDLCQKLDVTN